MIKVNLVPAEILAKARQRQLMLQASVVGGVLAVVVVVISLIHWAGLYALQSDYKYKDAKLHELAAIVTQVEELEKASAAVRARLRGGRGGRRRAGGRAGRRRPGARGQRGRRRQRRRRRRGARAREGHA